MAQNILLTSLSAAGNDLPLRYFSFQKEFGFDYCDALLDAEAGIKAVLARYDIDEIIVIGGDGAYDEKDKPDSAIPLRQGRSLYSEDKASFSTFRLLMYRIAQYADEIVPDRKEEELLPADVREKLTGFIQDFHAGSAELKEIKFNRFFDVLSQNDQICDEFEKALFEAYPDLRNCQSLYARWIRNYLYEALKPSAKLEFLPVNEKTCVRLVPADSMEGNGKWVSNMMAMKNSILLGREDINLYVSLCSDNATDTFILINVLDILTSMPESRVRLKKVFALQDLQDRMAGIIRDDTEVFGVTELFHALHSFVNYGKADMIVKIWEKSNEHNESIAGMVYAMRHVDVGLSMCNIPEVESGILRLRKLFRDEEFWKESGYYGMLFSVIAESIREDYGSLLEGDGNIPFIELVKWAYRHQFYQQTLTLIESKAPENLVNTGLFYYCDDEKKAPQITKLFAEQRLELKSYEYYKMENIEHYFIKTYGRGRVRGGGRDSDPQREYAAMRTKSVDNRDPSLITGITACSSRETLMNLLFAYYHIGDVRNKINHAETTKLGDSRLVVSESDESAALVRTKDSVDFFIESYEKAVAELQGKKPRVVLISSDDVRRAAENMRQNPRRES